MLNRWIVVLGLMAATAFAQMSDPPGQAKAWEYNPRDGTAGEIGTLPNSGIRQFLPPGLGEPLDWILVIDDAVKTLRCPGNRDRYLVFG
jgi:hypothetical protein